MISVNTFLYTVLHFLVDGICALSMFGRFSGGDSVYRDLLLYNFCAFALQMPFGVILDSCLSKTKSDQSRNLPPYLCAVTGVALTIAGAFLHPVLAGIGNALFHTGGGVGVIRENFARKRRGADLGIFVAPGALGLYLGTQSAKSGLFVNGGPGFILLFLVMLALSALLGYCIRPHRKAEVLSSVFQTEEPLPADCIGAAALALCCFAVVVIRSFVGMTVSFSWKSSTFLSSLGVLAVVSGKMAGGILAAKYHIRPVVLASLIFAAVGYLFRDYAIFGLAALFFFNMTMPLTLYLLVSRFRQKPGFSFGLLTFALFLGFLPAYFGMNSIFDSEFTGVAGSLLSLILLITAIRIGGRQNNVQ